jgi:periplasmic mercuric ion binding protein
MALLATVVPAKATPDKKTIVFKVYGNCGMCKKNIESALEIKGVKSAVWNVETKMIEVVYLPEIITEDKIHEAIAKAGYDTDKVKARDEDYKRLHTCCQYRKE